MEPDAQMIDGVRNYLEHRYLKLTDDHFHDESEPHESGGFVYTMPEEAFAAKTLRLLKLVRASIIYLSLAVHREERLNSKDDGAGLIMPIGLSTIDDDWKV